MDTTEVGTVFHDLNLQLTGIDRLPALRTEQWYRTVHEMTTQDPTVGAVLFAVEMMSRAVPWMSEPANLDAKASQADKDAAKEWADFLKECFDDMPDAWPDIVADALTFVAYGYSLFETVYKLRNGYSEQRALTSNYDDGRIGWRKWAFRPQASKVRWEMDQGDVAGWTQRTKNYQEVTIPIEKLQVFRSSARQGQPEGGSILKRAYRPYYHKRETEVQEAIGVSRDLAGMIVVEVPEEILEGTSAKAAAARTAYKQMIKHVQRGIQEGIMIPSSVDQAGNKMVKVSLIASPGTRQFDTTKIIERWRTDIAMTMLADFILVGHQQVGTYSMTESKVDTFTRAIGGWLDMMQEAINEQSVQRLLRMNGCPQEFMPKWTHGQVEKIDLAAMGDFLQKMFTTGALPKTKELAKWLAENAGTPVPTDAELDLAFPEDALRPAPMLPPGQLPTAVPPTTDVPPEPPTATLPPLQGA